MSRPRSRPGRKLVRTSERSRSDQEHLQQAYELTLPWARRVIAASQGRDAATQTSKPGTQCVPLQAKARANLCFVSVAQPCFGGR